MSQAMIRGVMDESGEQFVAYFLPTQETMEKRQADFVGGRDYDEEGEYEYKMFREYNWNVKSKTTKGYEENYFFVCRDEGLFYNELETRSVCFIYFSRCYLPHELDFLFCLIHAAYL